VVQGPTADLQHFKTPPGIAKLAQILFGIILLCLGPPIWIYIVGWICLMCTVPWVWIYFFQFNKRYTVNPPWIVLEFYYTAGAFLAYGIMSFLFFITLSIVSAVFGLITTAAYGVGAFFLFKDWQAWRANPINMVNVPK